MDPGYISSDEEEIYMKSNPEVDEITDIGDLRTELQRFQQEDIVKEALKNDVDLTIYGTQIDNELRHYTNVSVKDYIDESKNIASLHIEVESCYDVLKEMEDIMEKYQIDLDKAVNEIHILQSQSETISLRLNNRKVVDNEIRDIVNNLIIQPSMGEMNEDFFMYLNKFSSTLDYVDCIGVDDAVMMQRNAIKAIESIRIDLNILKLHCGNRIRDAVMRKLAEITKDSNIEMFQKEVLLKMKDGIHFVQRHLPTYYKEIEEKYIDIMHKVVYQIFNEYYQLLSKRLYEIGTADDLIVGQKVKQGLLHKKIQIRSPLQQTPFVLSDRHAVIDFINDAPLLPSFLIMDNEYICYIELFRSIQRHLIDCALAEFEFEVQFFDIEDTSMFIEVFGSASEIIHEETVNWIRSSYDIIGIMLFCVLAQNAVESIAKEGVPILQEFFLNLRSKAMYRFKELLNYQIRNVKSVPVQPKNLGITSEVHSSIKNYAELSCAIYVIGYSYENYIDKELWSDLMSTLSLEMVNLLMKLASCIVENKRPSFILNSCLYVAEVYGSRHITVENDFIKLYQDRLHLYIEEMMAKHFAPLVSIVDKYSDRSNGIAFSSIEGKNITKYNGGWRESIRTVNERIQLDFKYKTVAVYTMFANEVSSYHAKYIQLLQGTPYAKDATPVQTVVNELMKYRAEYDVVPSNTLNSPMN